MQKVEPVKESVKQSYKTVTRTAYLYNGCLAWYNVVLTSRVHSSVKYSQQSLMASEAWHVLTASKAE